MPATVTKSQLMESIKDIFASNSKGQAEGGAKIDNNQKDSISNNYYSDLVYSIDSIFNYTNDLETWSHAGDLTTQNPFQDFLSLDAVASEAVSTYVYERAEQYFSQNKIRTRELDWFYLDFVVAVGFRVLLKQYEDKDFKSAYPTISRALDEFDGSNILALVKYILIGAVRNAIIFGLAAFFFILASGGQAWAGLLGGALVAWKIYGWLNQRKIYRKLKGISVEKLSQYNSLYKLFSGGFVRWDLLEHDIKRLRDLSIDFPLALDTAVTSRKKLM
jgi:hypothetical protein